MAIQENFYNDMFEDRPTGGRTAMQQREDLANLLAEKQNPDSEVVTALAKQILASSNTSKWTGAGKGSAEANARDMARIMAGIGITDIKQFGPITREVDAYIGTDDNGTPIYDKQTERTFGNKETGQAVPLTYSGRQTGNFFGGTYDGKGNTGYGVMFDGQGNPIFYTQGASSNTLANLMKDLGPIGQIGLAIATGGLSIPQQIAANMALQVLSGQDIGSAIKNAAVSLAVAQIPATDFMKQANKYIGSLDLPAGVTNTLNSSFQNAATSGARALLTGQDVSDAMLKGAAAGGTSGAVNALMREIPGFGSLSRDQQRMATNAVIGVVSGRPLDQIMINAAIAAANAEVAEQKKYAPLNEKALAELDPDELKKYNEGGTKALYEYQNTIKNLNSLTKSGRTGDDTGGDTGGNTGGNTVGDPDVDALKKSGLTTSNPNIVTITGAKTKPADDPTDDIDDLLKSIFKNATPNKDSGLSNKDIEDLIRGRTPVKRDDRVTVTAKREPEPVDTPILNPIFTTPVKPNAPNIGPQGTVTITTTRPPTSPVLPPPDPVSLITNPLPPVALPPTVAPPTTPAPSTPSTPSTPATPRINIDPVKALETLYNPFTPTPKAPPVQTDTGPIQLMTDVFGTNIATSQKAAARGYGFSAGGDIDELLRLLRN